MKNGGKNKSVAFIILVSVYSIHQVNIFNIKYVNNRHAHKQLANSENWS